MSVGEHSYRSVSRALAASLVSPGVAPILAYLLVISADVALPDRFAPRVFLFEAVMFYVLALPAMWLLRGTNMRKVAYVIVGAFVTWPAWFLFTLLPSDASVNPVNPQLFFVATTTLFGAVTGTLFFAIMGASKYQGNRPAKRTVRANAGISSSASQGEDR